MIVDFGTAKVSINRALDAAAGRRLTPDERRDWWVAEDRYLRVHDDEAERAAILQEAKESKW